jgi:hypothetical protein
MNATFLDIFQTEIAEAVMTAGRAGVEADTAVYLLVAQAFSLFMQTAECGDSHPLVEFLRVAHLAAFGVINRLHTDLQQPDALN